METPTRPNVLLIVTDQQRWDTMGCAGHPVLRTPNIDALARGGVQFESAYTAHPTCTPSRSTMMTGRYPSSHRARMTGQVLPESETTMPQVLREAGYETALFGKAHFAPFGAGPNEGCSSREAHSLWGKSNEYPITGNYYGFERVVFAGGHGTGIYGPYRDWLRERDPDALTRLDQAWAPYGGDYLSGYYADGSSDMRPFPVDAALHPTSWLAEVVTDYIREPHERPFFAMASFPDPHHPFCPPPEYADMYDPADMPRPIAPDAHDFADWPEHYRLAYHGEIEQYSGGGRIDFSSVPERVALRGRALTAGMVGLIDTAIGGIMQALNETNQRENTIVIFCSDHGDYLGDHGFMYKGPFPWDGVLRVPFIWSYPALFPHRRVDDYVASTVDIAPTVLTLCGAEVPYGVEGVTLDAWLCGDGEYPRREALTENDDDYVGERLRTLTTPDWKITVYSGREYGELYDRRNDPDETRNLWSDSGYRSVRDELRLRLLDVVLATQDRKPVQRWYA